MTFDGTYNVSVKTPMGAQKGKLTIKTSENTFSGTLETASGASNFSGGSISGNTLYFRAETKTPMGEFNISYRVTIDGNNLTGEAKTSFGSAPLEGIRI